MKNKIISFFCLFTLLFTLISSVATAQEIANEVVVDASQAELVADVNIRNAQIVSQEGNTFKISFDLTNGLKTQPAVMYSVQIFGKIPERENEFGALIHEEIYGDVVSLSENDSVHKEITFVAPNYLNGGFKLVLNSQNESGLPYAMAFVGDVSFVSVGEYALMDNNTCYLLVGEEKFSTTYGVDVSGGESLSLSCTINNNFAENKKLIPFVQTRERTSFGKLVNEPNLLPLEITPKDSVRVVFDLGSITNKPQSYNSTIVLRDESGKEVSNTINFQYVVRGNSSTIQNARTDKDYYKKGEIAVVNVLISGRADSFPGARAQNLDESKLFVDSVISGGMFGKCSDIVTSEVNQGDDTAINIPVTKNCYNPTLKVSLKDANGNILDEKNFGIETKTDVGIMGVILSSWFVLAVILIALVYVVVMIATKKNKKIKKALSVFVFIVGGIALFGGAGDVDAATFNFDVTNGHCNVQTTVNLNKSLYSASETMTATASAVRFSCCNNLSSASAIVSWVNNSESQIPANFKTVTTGTFTGTGEHTDTIVYSGGGSTTKTAPSTAGGYTAKFRVNYVEVHSDGNVAMVSDAISIFTVIGRPTASISSPSGSSFVSGTTIDFSGSGTLGSGGSSINEYAWVDTNSGTESYSGTRCATADGTTLSSSSSFSKSNLSVGTHKICLNVKQLNADNSEIWAGPNSAFRTITITAAPACGDGSCNGEETCSNCSGDCGACPASCGNGSCETGESCTNCSSDCGACPAVCGNGTCETGEDCSDCSGDCGACPTGCGDGVCGSGETCETCSSDCTCSSCGNGVCEAGEDNTSCSGDCAVGCGDGICAEGEFCPDDCDGAGDGAQASVCGDEICASDENFLSCPSDCIGATFEEF